ncbi:hypothetical protein ACFV3F_34225 [Streptomyces sp. NPDC059717]|uniref:hypothetical protein n=1 Tax=Streptomyces sp. NPDC059717 TaxID=3346922 RepID=UPI0036A0ED05
MNCTICGDPIEDGEPLKRHARRDRNGGALPPGFTHKRCRKRPSTVPFITSWSSELTGDPAVLLRPIGGIGYAGEVASDRDERGVLWQRRPDSPGVGRPMYGKVNTGRQRRAMTELLCQVCGGPAAEDHRGVLWLIEDNREDYEGWPEDLLTTHPPICLPCVGKARAECPHLWAGSVAVRAGRSEVCAVYGRRYVPGGLGPVPAEVGVVAFEEPVAAWVMASQLVRSLADCAIVSLDDELGAAVSRQAARH